MFNFTGLISSFKPCTELILIFTSFYFVKIKLNSLRIITYFLKGSLPQRRAFLIPFTSKFVYQIQIARVTSSRGYCFVCKVLSAHSQHKWVNITSSLQSEPKKLIQHFWSMFEALRILSKISCGFKSEYVADNGVLIRLYGYGIVLLKSDKGKVD